MGLPREGVVTVPSGLRAGPDSPVPLCRTQGAVETFRSSPNYLALCGETLDRAMAQVPFYERWRPFRCSRSAAAW
jgi:hypothetical protein